MKRFNRDYIALTNNEIRALLIFLSELEESCVDLASVRFSIAYDKEGRELARIPVKQAKRAAALRNRIHKVWMKKGDPDAPW